MSKLQAPLKPLLEDRLPEQDVHRIWRTLQARRAPAPPRRRWVWQLSAAAAMLALGWLSISLRQPATPGPLALAGEHASTQPRALGGDQPTRLALADGSRIQLERGALLEVVHNTGREFSLRMQRGHAVFEVEPGGPRRWRVDCGLVSVEVVGTGFTLERSDWGVAVHVLHGSVEVRGARVPGGVRLLGAGQNLTVREPAPAPAAGAASPPQARAAKTPPAADGGMPARPASRIESATPPEDLPTLLRAADIARRAGDEPRAQLLLEQVLQRAPNTRHASLAAITLGRMQMASDPAAAARSLRTALKAGPPRDLREDTLARLVEAYARAGQSVQARAAAAEYRAAFPEGRRSAEVQSWIAAP